MARYFSPLPAVHEGSSSSVLFAAASVSAGTLPGFRVQLLGSTSGFADSIAIDSRSTIYYTTTAGNLFRFGNGKSELVTHVKTVAIGNSGLVGLALRDDNTAIVHYTSPGSNSFFRTGCLLGAFVTKALYYIPDIDVRPLPDPIPVIQGVTGPITDVNQSTNGDIFFVTGSAIYRLIPPLRGTVMAMGGWMGRTSPRWCRSCWTATLSPRSMCRTAYFPAVGVATSTETESSIRAIWPR